MIVSITFDIDTDVFADEYDTKGMTATQVRRKVRDVIDQAVRKDPAIKPFLLPGLTEDNSSWGRRDR